MTMPTSNPAGAPMPFPRQIAIGTFPSCPVNGDIAANEMNSTPPSPTAAFFSWPISVRCETSSESRRSLRPPS